MSEAEKKLRRKAIIDRCTLLTASSGREDTFRLFLRFIRITEFRVEGTKEILWTSCFPFGASNTTRDSIHFHADRAFQPLHPGGRLPTLCKPFAYFKERFYQEGHKGRFKALFSRNFKRSIPNTPEKAMAPHSSTPAWRIPWMEKPGRL